MATVAIRFEADIADIRAALAEVEDGAESAATSLGKTADQASGAADGLRSAANTAGRMAAAALAAGAAIGTMASSLAQSINELSGMSAQTGIATETLAGLRLAARAGGRELQDLEGILRKVAAEGLNIEEVTEQIQAIEDPTRRAAKAMEIFGEEGAVLVQVLGNRSVSEFSEFAERFGTSSGPEAAAAAQEFQLQMLKLETAIMGVVDSGLLEFVNSLIEDFSVGVVFLRELIAGEFDLAMTRQEALDNAIASALEFRGALRDVTTGVDESAESWEEFRLRQELGLNNSHAIVFGQTLEDVKEATDKSTEAARAYADALHREINFGQTADDIEDMRKQWEAAAEAFGGTAVVTSVSKINELAKSTEGVSENLDDVVRKAKRLQAIQDFGAAASDGLASVAAGGQAVSMVATQIGDAFEAFGAKSEKAARAAFAANKAAGIADAVVKTAQGIMNAFATLPTPVALGVAPFVAATGAAQIATIAATTFDGGGTAGGGAGLGSGASGALDSSTSATGATVPGVTKGFQEDVTGTRMTRGGMTYRHRDLDVVARDGRRYPGGAFDAGGGTGQTRYDS
jgi:hypothetical protein